MKETLAWTVIRHSEVHGHSLILARERAKRIKSAQIAHDLVMDYQHERVNCCDYFYIGSIEAFMELNGYYGPMKGDKNENR